HRLAGTQAAQLVGGTRAEQRLGVLELVHPARGRVPAGVRRLQRDRQPLELGGNQLASLLLGLPELQRLELPDALRRRRLARARAERVELLEQRLVGEERRPCAATSRRRTSPDSARFIS